MKLNIGWLYPKQMSTYGDRGNILTLYQRCKWRDIEVEIHQFGLGDKIDSNKIDLYFFGGGQDIAQYSVSKDLQKTKKDELAQAAEDGAVFLTICGGYQLIGNYYKTPTGEELPGIGILDVFTVSGDTRMIGNIVIESGPQLGQRNLVGFENHSGKTYLGKNALPMGRVLVGNGNNGEDRTEGAVQKNLFGCYLHGPLLPKNPKFADYLIEKSLNAKHKNFRLKELDDSLENMAHDSAYNRAFGIKQ